MHSQGSGGLSILRLCILYIPTRIESERLRMFTEVNTYAVNYLSNTCHTPVTPLFSIYLHRVTGSSDKTRCRRMYLQLPVTLSH